MTERAAWLPPVVPAPRRGDRRSSAPARRPRARGPSPTAITRPEMPAVRPPAGVARPRERADDAAAEAETATDSARQPLVSVNDLFDPYDEDEITSVGRVTEAGEPPPVPTKRDRAVLVRTDGVYAGRVVDVDRAELLVGRARDADVRLEGEGVSRRHARLFVEGGTYFIEDLGSSNGTYVQGRRVSSFPVSDGDTIQIGPRVGLRFALVDEQQRTLLQQLYESSVRDPLTGAYNRQHFDERLHTEVAYAVRHRTALSLVMFDIDFFKRVNDTHGHQAGDAVLCHIVGTVAPRLRTEDVFARYGGEEFTVILRGIDLAGARRVGERLRTAVSGSPPVFSGSLIPITVSVGAASLDCCDDRSADALVAAADRRLYVAKRTGRNRVVAAG